MVARGALCARGMSCAAAVALVVALVVIAAAVGVAAQENSECTHTMALGRQVKVTLGSRNETSGETAPLRVLRDAPLVICALQIVAQHALFAFELEFANETALGDATRVDFALHAVSALDNGSLSTDVLTIGSADAAGSAQILPQEEYVFDVEAERDEAVIATRLELRIAPARDVVLELSGITVLMYESYAPETGSQIDVESEDALFTRPSMIAVFRSVFFPELFGDANSNSDSQGYIELYTEATVGVESSSQPSGSNAFRFAQITECCETLDEATFDMNSSTSGWTTQIVTNVTQLDPEVYLIVIRPPENYNASLTAYDAVLVKNAFNYFEPTDDSVCFPASATAELESGALVPVRELQLLDRVRTRRGFSPIFAFGHADEHAVAKYVEISAPPHAISLSAEHLIYIARRGVPAELTGGSFGYSMSRDGERRFELRRAAAVVVGDRIAIPRGDGGELQLARVHSVRRSVQRGAFHPHTLEGDIVIDGVLASCYSSYVHAALAHALLAPFRAAAAVALLQRARSADSSSTFAAIARTLSESFVAVLRLCGALIEALGGSRSAFGSIAAL